MTLCTYQSIHELKITSYYCIIPKQEFSFNKEPTRIFSFHYVSDMFSGLTATMIFRRRSMYYIFQMYIPCVCVVALSWVSFWINHEAVPARVALSITTVLTISYMRGNVNAGMPRVSYLKSIDYFLLGGFVFIFMTLLEYVLVLKQSRKIHAMNNTKKDDCELSQDKENLVSSRPVATAVHVRRALLTSIPRFL